MAAGNLDIQNAMTHEVMDKAQRITSDTNGSSVDLRDYVGDPVVHINVGWSGGDADETLDIKLQESDDDSTWSDAGQSLSQIGNADAFNTMKLSQRGLKRHVRLVYTTGGTTPQYDIAASVAGFKQVQ